MTHNFLEFLENPITPHPIKSHYFLVFLEIRFDINQSEKKISPRSFLILKNLRLVNTKNSLSFGEK